MINEKFLVMVGGDCFCDNSFSFFLYSIGAIGSKVTFLLFVAVYIYDLTLHYSRNKMVQFIQKLGKGEGGGLVLMNPSPKIGQNEATATMDFSLQY